MRCDHLLQDSKTGPTCDEIEPPVGFGVVLISQVAPLPPQQDRSRPPGAASAAAPAQTNNRRHQNTGVTIAQDPRRAVLAPSCPPSTSLILTSVSLDRRNRSSGAPAAAESGRRRPAAAGRLPQYPIPLSALHAQEVPASDPPGPEMNAVSSCDCTKTAALKVETS